MQNTDLTKIIITDEENLDLAPSISRGPASLDCILNASDVIETQTGFQSDPETHRTKQKSRSRFSAAFRRLSKSTRKKEHPITKKDLELTDTTVPAQPTVEEKSQSVDAHIDEKPAKKKSSLTRRFLLGGLKRTKSSSKKITDEEDNIILVSSSGTQTTNTLERRSTLPTQHSLGPQSSAITDTLKESHTSLVSADSLSGGGGSLQRLDRIRKVQITIRGKKIEHTQSEISVQTTGAIAGSGGGSTEKVPTIDTAKEKDYLIPADIEPPKTKQSILVKTSSSVRSRSPSPGSSPSKSGATDPKAKTKKKLKLKKITSSTTKQIATTTTTKTTKTTNNKKVTQTTTASAAPTQSQPTTQSTEEKEKFVITRSTRDTPPRERAPTKPSRVVAASSDVAISTVALAPTSQSSAASGAIRKPTTRAAATLTAPRLTPIKHTLKTAAKQQQKLQQQQEQQKTAAAKSPIIEAESLKSQSDLMHNPQDGIERGHRFPSPTTPTTTTAAIATETIDTTTIGNETPPTTTSTSSTPTIVKTPSIEITEATTTTNSAQHQRQIQFQLLSESQASKTLSLSSSSPPPSPSLVPTNSHTDLQAEQQPTTLQPPTYPPPPIPSGTSTPETRSPERRSHSPLPSEQLYLATRFLPGATKSVASAHSSDIDEAISSAESAQQQHSYARNYGEISCDSNKSSESQSQSPISETSRRRIRYVAQPTLYDDDDEEPLEQNEESASRPESRREALSFLYSAVSDYSLESEEGDQGDNPQMPAFGDLTMDQGEPQIMTSTAEKREHLYKILVIGELGTGKTSFIKRYVHQFFSQNYRATIGVDFALKVLHWDANTIVRLQLWDIAGQERFGNMTRVYYKEAVGAFIVFDVTRSGTFDCVAKWKEDLDSKVQLPDGSPIPCILLANKCDQDKQGVVTTPEKMDEYVKDNGFAGWFETSAKENINIEEAARALVNKILLNDKLISAADIADSEKFNLNNSADQSVTETKSKCSC